MSDVELMCCTIRMQQVCSLTLESLCVHVTMLAATVNSKVSFNNSKGFVIIPTDNVDFLYWALLAYVMTMYASTHFAEAC